MADILWSDIVGDMTVESGGYMGDLLTIARAHVDEAVQTNRLTTAQAGEIYTAMIPAAMQNAINFGMNEQLTEAGIDKAIADAETARAQADREYALMLASIDKEFGYDYTLDVNDELIKSSLVDAADGTLDATRDKTKAEAEVAKTLAVEAKDGVDLTGWDT